MLVDLLNTILAIDSTAIPCAQRHIDGLLRSIVSLEKLEVPATQLAGMPGLNSIPHVGKKAALVMCVDHGVWGERIAISPKGMTAIQAENTTRGTTDVCVLAEQAGANVHVIDVSIDTAEPIPGFISMRIAQGSGNIASAPVMSRHQAEELFLDVICYAQELAKNGVTLSGVGELGVANTTSTTAVANTITGWSPKEVVGINVNPPTDKLANKIDVVRRAITLNQSDPQDDVDVLVKVDGFDLIGIAGVMLGAASCGLPMLLDGFPSYAVALVACQMSPAIKLYFIPSHLSAERGARITLLHLGLEPYLDMEMRLGEGSGAALAIPIIETTCAIYNNMGELVASNIVLPGNTTSDLNS